MKIRKVYEAETGKKAMYRINSSDYMLMYVQWLEDKIINFPIAKRHEEYTQFQKNYSPDT